MEAANQRRKKNEMVMQKNIKHSWTVYYLVFFGHFILHKTVSLICYLFVSISTRNDNFVRHSVIRAFSSGASGSTSTINY